MDNDAPERLAAIFAVGPSVALEIIDDGMAHEPRYLHPLVLHALKFLQQPEPIDLVGYTRMLLSAVTMNDSVRGLIADGLRDALGGPSVPRATAYAVQRTITELGSESGASASVRGLGTVKRDPTRSNIDEPDADWTSFTATLEDYSDDSNGETLKAIGDLLRRIAASGMRVGWETDLQSYLSDPEVALIAEEALTHVAAASPLLVASLRHEVMPTLWRRPVELPIAISPD